VTLPILSCFVFHHPRELATRKELAGLIASSRYDLEWAGQSILSCLEKPGTFVENEFSRTETRQFRFASRSLGSSKECYVIRILTERNEP
jgi:hypothetical protein